jgi:hypothetical protein
MNGCGCSSKISSSVGPKGDTGAAGARGETGATGPKGDPGGTPEVTPVTTPSVTLTGTDSGTVLLNRPAGSDIQLPTAPADGTFYSIQVVSETIAGYNIATGGTDVFAGYINMNKAGDYPIVYPAAGTETNISLNGSTSGGLIGTNINIVYSNGVWQTSGQTMGSGATITPFV